MKALLIAALLAVTASVFGQSEDEEAVLDTIETFFAALREARGEDAAALYSSQALEQVDLTFQSLREGIRRSDEGVLLRIQSAGYVAGTQEIRGWTTRQYLAETLKLPMMTGRYTPFLMEVLSIEVRGRRAVVQVAFENTSGVVIEQTAVAVKENDAWLMESFMGMTTFP